MKTLLHKFVLVTNDSVFAYNGIKKIEIRTYDYYGKLVLLTVCLLDLFSFRPNDWFKLSTFLDHLPKTT